MIVGTESYEGVTRVRANQGRTLVKSAGYKLVISSFHNGTLSDAPWHLCPKNDRYVFINLSNFRCVASRVAPTDILALPSGSDNMPAGGK